MENKPCPFCGQTTELLDSETFVENGEGEPTVVCMYCDYEVITAMYNRRPLEDKLRDEVKKLREGNAELKKRISENQKDN